MCRNNSRGWQVQQQQQQQQQQQVLFSITISIHGVTDWNIINNYESLE